MAKKHTSKFDFIETYNKNGLTVSLGRRLNPDGISYLWVVQLRSSLRKVKFYKLHKCEDVSEAQKLFEAFRSGSKDPFNVSHNETIDDLLELAAKIVDHDHKLAIPPTLALLFAVDRHKSTTTNKQYHTIGDACIRLLQSQLTLPPPLDTDLWRTYIKTITKILVTKSVQRTVVAEDTAKHRLRFLRRALLVLTDYSHCFPAGMEYSAQAAKAPALIKDVHSRAKDIRARATYKPLTLSEINKLLSHAPTFQLKLHLLKLLSFGFRPTEGLKAEYIHIIQGKLALKQIITKVKPAHLNKIFDPESTLILRVLLKSQLPLQPSDKVWLEKELTLPLKQLRTTCACHILYSGASVEDVRQRLGHTSIDMAIRHYNASPVADIGNLNPEEYYDLPERISVRGVTVGDPLAFDRYLLLKLLHIASNDFPDFKEQVISTILEESSPIQKVRRASADF